MPKHFALFYRFDSVWLFLFLLYGEVDGGVGSAAQNFIKLVLVLDFGPDAVLGEPLDPVFDVLAVRRKKFEGCTILVQFETIAKLISRELVRYDFLNATKIDGYCFLRNQLLLVALELHSVVHYHVIHKQKVIFV